MITSPQAFDATIASAMVENYGPGTIYTYNPLHFTRFVQKTVHASHLYLDKHGKPKPDSLSGQLSHTGSPIPSADAKSTRASTMRSNASSGRAAGGPAFEEESEATVDAVDEVAIASS